MDEILSSIRQIIADDDEGAAQKAPVARSVAKPAAPQPIKASEPEPARELEPEPEPDLAAALLIDPFSDDDDDDVPPLALSPEQIVGGEPSEDQVEEIEFPVPEMPSAASLDAAAELVVPDDVAFQQDEDPVVPPQPRPASFSKAAPMPDPDLSADLADELLEPATSAAVRSAFSKLNAPRLTPEMTLGAGGVTIEAMIREMLRPMLKEWLDENLPSMVERIVAQEIERVSRGG